MSMEPFEESIPSRDIKHLDKNGCLSHKWSFTLPFSYSFDPLYAVLPQFINPPPGEIPAPTGTLTCSILKEPPTLGENLIKKKKESKEKKK